MNDARYALRTLARTPGFTATAILTLALGIGVTTAIFSVVKAVVLDPLPYRDPARLVVTRLSLPDYRDVQRASRSFEQTAFWATNLYNIEAGSEDRQVLGAVVSHELLSVLGITPAAGRLFTIAQALGVEVSYFFDGMDNERAFKPTPQQRMLLELARNFISMPSRKHQEAICNLARALANPELVASEDIEIPLEN